MNIAVFVHHFPDMTESFILDQITWLIDRGHSARIFALKHSGQKQSHPSVRRYGLLDKTVYLGKRRSLKPEELKGTDIIQAHFGTVAEEFIHLKREYGIPFFTFFHGFDVMPVLKRSPRAYRGLLAKSDHSFVPSRFLRLCLLKHEPAAAHKITVLNYGIDTKLYSYEKRNLAKKIRILTVARFVEKKGIEYSLWAIAKLLEKYKNIEYTVVGEGPCGYLCRKIAGMLGMKKRVKFAGFSSRGRIIRLMHSSDIFLLSSITAANSDTEGLPVVLLEAQSTGLPVVATSHAGIPEAVIDGKTGLLVKEKDIDGMKDALEKLILNPSLRSAMGKEGRINVQVNFNMTDKMKTLENFYNS